MHHACGCAAIACVRACVPLFTRESRSFVSCRKRSRPDRDQGRLTEAGPAVWGGNGFFLKFKWKWGRREADLQGRKSVRSGRGGKVLAWRRISHAEGIPQCPVLWPPNKWNQGSAVSQHLSLVSLRATNFCAPGLSTMKHEERLTKQVRFAHCIVLQMSPLWDPKGSSYLRTLRFVSGRTPILLEAQCWILLQPCRYFCLVKVMMWCDPLCVKFVGWIVPETSFLVSLKEVLIAMYENESVCAPSSQCPLNIAIPQ